MVCADVPRSRLAGGHPSVRGADVDAAGGAATDAAGDAAADAGLGGARGRPWGAGTGRNTVAFHTAMWWPSRDAREAHGALGTCSADAAAPPPPTTRGRTRGTKQDVRAVNIRAARVYGVAGSFQTLSSRTAI